MRTSLILVNGGFDLINNAFPKKGCFDLKKKRKTEELKMEMCEEK